MEAEPIYYYDLLARQWWQYVPEEEDWSLLSQDMADAINLDSHLAGLNKTITLQTTEPEMPQTPKNDDKTSDSPVEQSQTLPNIEETNDVSARAEPVVEEPEPNNTARNEFIPNRDNTRKVSYVREAARRLTYKDPGGFADVIKAVAETRDEMLKNATKDDFEPKKDDSKLKYMIKRAQEMARTTLQTPPKIEKLVSTEIKEIDRNKILKKKISKELNSPSDSDGDFSSEDSDRTSSTDSEPQSPIIKPIKEETSAPPSLAQLMTIKMRLRQKLKNLNK